MNAATRSLHRLSLPRRATHATPRHEPPSLIVGELLTRHCGLLCRIGGGNIAPQLPSLPDRDPRENPRAQGCLRILWWAIESQTRDKQELTMHSSRACCALLFAMLLAGCGSSGAPPTLKLTPQLALVTNYSTQTGDPYTVSAFTVNSSDGSLTQISGSPFSVGNGPNS